MGPFPLIYREEDGEATGSSSRHLTFSQSRCFVLTREKSAILLVSAPHIRSRLRDVPLHDQSFLGVTS